MRGRMSCKVALLILPAALVLPTDTAACSIRHISWQPSAVWPNREALTPLNAHVDVDIPTPFGGPLAEPAARLPTSALLGRVAPTIAEPVAAHARALSLREVTAADGPGNLSPPSEVELSLPPAER